MESKKELDYFLFDNKTKGLDWGVKAATGELENRTDLRNLFVKYCNFIFGGRGSFSLDGSCAIGGFREPDEKGRGYVLCVTIETIDRSGRNSLATIGLWFSYKNALCDFIRDYDLIIIVKQVFGTPDLPSNLLAIEKKNADKKPKTSIDFFDWYEVKNNFFIKEFKPNESHEITIDLLKKSCGGFGDLPSIMGVTRFFNQDELKELDYDLIFCSPIDIKGKYDVPTSIERIPKFEAEKKLKWRHFFVILGVVMIIGLLWWGFSGDDKVKPKQLVITEHNNINGSVIKTPTSNESYFQQAQQLLTQVESLDVFLLKKSRAYEIAKKVEVRREFQEQRNEILMDFENLPELRNKILESISYYFKKETEDLPLPGKVTQIKSNLSNLRRKFWQYNHNCNRIKSAFGFEFSSQRGSHLVKWCNTLEDLFAIKSSKNGT